MLRPVSLLPALTAVASLGVFLLAPVLAAAPAAAAPKAVQRAPLAVVIESLSASQVPRRGPIQVTGSVTNRDTGTWSTVNVYAFMSDAPMTSSAELADAATTPASTEVGSRIIDAGAPETEDTIDRLEPGESATFSISVPHRDLPVTGAGVYWFGVHALGEGPEGRVDGADGRARTFLPYVPPTARALQAALVVPVRHQVVHAPDGSLADVRSWVRTLSPGGSLWSLVELGVASGSRQVTWLVDPAVVDAVRRLADGNPPRSLDPTDAESGGGESPDGSGSPSADASPSPSPSPPGSGDGGQDAQPATSVEQRAADAAAAWLDRLHTGLVGHEVLTLPYGDVDVAGAAAYDPGTYAAARKRSSGDLQPWGLPTTPAVASPTGYIDNPGIDLVEPDTTLVVSDRMLHGRAPAVVSIDGHRAAVASWGAVSGGPGPTYRRAPLAVRQRIVAEAAVRALEPGRRPLVTLFPSGWSPDTTAGFFEGLDLPWLQLTSMSTVLQRRPKDVPPESLDYPTVQQRLALGPAVFSSAEDLVRSGEVLQNLLTRNDQVAGDVQGEAFTDLSYTDRLSPELAESAARRARAWIERRLRSVHVDAPRAVILSSGSGRFAATVSNTLDQPVTVRIGAVADQPLRVAVPSDSIDLGPESRTTVLLNASSSAIGVRNVTLLLTDSDDVPLGSSDDVPIRSNRVSNVIWLIIGTGVALLFGAIAVRLVRRIRTAARS